MRLTHLLEGGHWLSDFHDRIRTGRRGRDYLESRQRKKFRQLVQYACKHSPYYAQLIAELGLDVDDCSLEDFPELTKQQVVEHFDQIVTDRSVDRASIEQFFRTSSDPTQLFHDRYYVVHTSGSSGRVGYFVFTSREWIRGCSHQLRFLGRLGLRRRTAFVGVSNGHFTGVSLAMTGRRLINRLFFDTRAFDVGQPTEWIVAGLNRFQPEILIAYGATMYMLAIEQQRGRLRIHPRRLVSSGEPLLSGSRSFIESAFECRLANVYASSEQMFMGLGDSDAETMYLFEDDLIFEIHTDHTCVTNLFNRTMPLIRYRMDDVLQPVPHTSDKLPFRRVKNVVGRNERPIVLENSHGQEDFVHPLIITEITASHLLAFQLRVISPTQLLFRAQLEPGIDSSQREQACREIAEKLRAILASKDMEQSVRFEIVDVDSLEVDPRSGKFRLIETDRTYASLVAPLDRAA